MSLVIRDFLVLPIIVHIVHRTSRAYPTNFYSGSLANAVGSLYVTKYFNEDSKAEALMMVSEIR